MRIKEDYRVSHRTKVPQNSHVLGKNCSKERPIVSNFSPYFLSAPLCKPTLFFLPHKLSLLWTQAKTWWNIPPAASFCVSSTEEASQSDTGKSLLRFQIVIWTWSLVDLCGSGSHSKVIYFWKVKMSGVGVQLCKPKSFYQNHGNGNWMERSKVGSKSPESVNIANQLPKNIFCKGLGSEVSKVGFDSKIYSSFFRLDVSFKFLISFFIEVKST